MAAMGERASHPLDQILAEVIAEEGGTCQAAEVRAEIAACLEEIRTEQYARGEDAPICHFYVTGSVAIFSLVGDGLDLYILRCPKTHQWEIVNRFERLARGDIEGYRRVLATRYGKENPDLVIEAGLAIDWLYGGQPSADSQPETAEAEGSAAPGAQAEATEMTDEAEQEPAAEGGYQGDPMLEQMMAAIRASGGGKGDKPLRPSDLG
jgi:hypothetical protein